MAVFDCSVPMTAIESLLAQDGYFTGVVVGEPFAPPSSPTAAIFIMDDAQASTTLTGSIENYVLQIRIYWLRATDPPGARVMEIGIGHAVSHVLAQLAGAFTLGGSVRAIDWAGEEGEKVSVKFGHIDLGGSIFRIADITVPLIIDDSTVFAP